MRHDTLFGNLQNVLAEWREERRLFPPLILRQERFRALTANTLTPLLEALAKTLQEAGLAVEVSVNLEEDPQVGLFIAQYEGHIVLSPDPNNPSCLWLRAQGGYIGEEAPRQWKLNYGLIGNGTLERGMYDAIRCLLEPPQDR